VARGSPRRWTGSGTRALSSGGESADAGYLVPATIHRAEEEARRSRFIATIAPAPDPEAAHATIRSVQREYPDATHHCWAFVAGPPGSTARIGLSDAGEPHGTAGRPILNTLLHSGVGEIVAVVTRYFGGVKLGKGGLGRAYASAVARALETLPTVRRVSLIPVRIDAPYAAIGPLCRVLDVLDARERVEEFPETGRVEIRVQVPEGEVATLRSEVGRITKGEGRMEIPSP
jgi:uncharacterized YigZ family protein